LGELDPRRRKEKGGREVAHPRLDSNVVKDGSLQPGDEEVSSLSGSLFERSEK